MGNVMTAACLYALTVIDDHEPSNADQIMQEGIPILPFDATGPDVSVQTICVVAATSIHDGGASPKMPHIHRRILARGKPLTTHLPNSLVIPMASTPPL